MKLSDQLTELNTFNTVQEFESQMVQLLDANARDYYQSGAWNEKSVIANQHDFNRYRFLPKILRDVSTRQCAVNIFNDAFSMPIGIAPTAFHQLAHDEGELATARAALQCNVPFVLSTLSNKSIEQVGAIFDQSKSKPWFQLYVHKDRGLTCDLIQRAEASGFGALVITVDAPLLGDRARDRLNRFTLPPGIIPVNVKQSLPQKVEGSALMRYFTEQIDPSLTFDTLAWLASQAKLPVIAKGVLRADDAQHCLSNGANGIIVSNHGGRQLDGSVSTIEALQLIVDTIGNDFSLFMDGGIRHGSDVIKALAIGAKAVFIGRPVLWGLACGGQQGVERVFAILKHELDLTLALCGCSSLADIGADLLLAR